MQRPLAVLYVASFFLLASASPFRAQTAAPPRTTIQQAPPAQQTVPVPTSTSPPDDSAQTPAPAATDLAPDEATKKIADLVRAGSYAEAKRMTSGLLIAYPDDPRLTKVMALIEKLTAPPPPPPSPPAPVSPADKLKGMDKVDYNALIVLARDAQQNTDLDEQKKLLLQFMAQSSTFLQKHPDLVLIWQLRAASAISLNNPLDGYEAGTQLLSLGAADGNDPALLQLLGQLKNKGWLDKKTARDQSIAIVTAAMAEIENAPRGAAITRTNSEPCLFHTRLFINDIDIKPVGKEFRFIYDSFDMDLTTLSIDKVSVITSPGYGVGLSLPSAVGTTMEVTRKDNLAGQDYGNRARLYATLNNEPDQCPSDKEMKSCKKVDLNPYEAHILTFSQDSANHLRDSVINAISACKALGRR